MDIWRQRPDAQQLGKVSPPSQPADNLWPLCVCLRVVLLRNGTLSSSNRARGPHKLPVQATERTLTNKRHVRFHLPISMCKKTMARVRKKGGKTTKHDLAAVFFTSHSLAFLTQNRRFATFPNKHKVEKLLLNKALKEKKKKYLKEKYSVGRGRPFPPHCCRGMRPENYLVVQVEEKRSPFGGAEFALKTDTSFTSV